MLWVNKKHLEEELDHKNLQEITTRYHSNHRRHKYELVDEPKKQPDRIFTSKKLIVKVILDCRTT